MLYIFLFVISCFLASDYADALEMSAFRRRFADSSDDRYWPHVVLQEDTLMAIGGGWSRIVRRMVVVSLDQEWEAYLRTWSKKQGLEINIVSPGRYDFLYYERGSEQGGLYTLVEIGYVRPPKWNDWKR